MFNFNQILETIPPKLKKKSKFYQEIYHCTDTHFVYTDGLGLILIPTDVPSDRHYKTFTHLNTESDKTYPRFTSITATKRKDSLYNVSLLNKLRTLKTKNLWLTANGTLHTQETIQKETEPYSIDLEILYTTFNLLRGLKDIEIQSIEQSDDDGMLILTCTNNIEIYIVFATTQYVQNANSK